MKVFSGSKSFPAVLFLMLTTLACSLGSNPIVVMPLDTPAANPAAGAESPATNANPNIPLDPRAAEPCAIFSAEEISAALGVTPQDMSPYKDSYEASCYYTLADGKTLSFKLELERPGRQAYDSIMQFVDVTAGSEPVTLGDIATIKQTGDDTVYLDAVIHGWYVSLQGFGFQKDAILNLGRLLEARLVAFTAPPAVAATGEPTSQPVSGTLLDMQVVIESPQEYAGTTTLESLKVVGIAGFAMCSAPGPGPFVVTFIAPPATDPPTPVGTFSITVEGSVEAGKPTDAVISAGLGHSDVAQSTNWPGTITVSEGGASGIFEAPGQIKGSWTCTFAP